MTDDPAGETYWRTANGIRLTGMPAFRGAISEVQLCQVSLVLLNAGKLLRAIKSSMQSPR